MMDNKVSETMERTKNALTGHLEDLMDEVEHDGRIHSRAVLDGIHKTVETMSLMGMLDGNPDDTAKPAVGIAERIRA